MIKNDVQYRVAKANFKKFQATLDRHEELMADQPQWVRKTHKATIVGEAKKLNAAIKEYESLRNGESAAPPLDVIAEIPYMLIKSRIALGWTQEDLANRLGVRPQQVQNDEATDYESASLSRLLRTAQVLQQANGKRRRAKA